MSELARIDAAFMSIGDMRSIADDLTELKGPGEFVHGLIDEIERYRKGPGPASPQDLEYVADMIFIAKRDDANIYDTARKIIAYLAGNPTAEDWQKVVAGNRAVIERLTKERDEAHAKVDALNKVARKAKVLSMKWTTPGMKMDGVELFGAVNDVHEAICVLYEVDPKRGFEFEESQP